MFRSSSPAQRWPGEWTCYFLGVRIRACARHAGEIRYDARRRCIQSTLSNVKHGRSKLHSIHPKAQRRQEGAVTGRAQLEAEPRRNLKLSCDWEVVNARILDGVSVDRMSSGVKTDAKLNTAE